MYSLMLFIYDFPDYTIGPTTYLFDYLISLQYMRLNLIINFYHMIFEKTILDLIITKRRYFLYVL